MLMVPVFGGVAALGGALLGSAACALQQITVGQRDFVNGTLDCLTEPLRWFDANPRDRLYVRAIEACELGRTSVRWKAPPVTLSVENLFTRRGRYAR